MRFTVPGTPVGKQRPRVVRNHGTVRTYTPDKTVNYENLVKLEYEAQGGEYMGESPVSMRITAYFPVPKSASKKRRALMTAGTILPTRPPDCDNIAKSVSDALNGVAFRDDAQVIHLEARKLYGDPPRVEIDIEPIRGSDP